MGFYFSRYQFTDSSVVKKKWFKWREIVWENTHHHLEQLPQQNKEFADHLHRVTRYEAEDRVWVSM